MARTDHTPYLSTTSAPSATTGSYTFASGASVLVLVMIINDGGSENPGTTLSLADTGAGLTWLPVTSADPGGGMDFAPGIRAFKATGNGSSCTLTASKTGVNAARWYIVPFSWSNPDTTPFGATASLTSLATDGPASGSLSAAPAATSDVIVGLVGTLTSASAISVLQGSGYTELYDTQSDDYGIFHVQVRTGSTSTTVDYQDTNVGSNSYYHGPVGAAVEAMLLVAQAANTERWDQAGGMGVRVAI